MNSLNEGHNSARRPDTLERLLALYANTKPNKLALVDPPNRGQLAGDLERFSHRSYTYATLNAAVETLARRFKALELPEGDYVGIQMPNVSEAPILVLALMRANLVPCLIPLSWGLDDLNRLFERLKPSALISCGLFEGLNHSLRMRELAFRNFHIRFVMGIGNKIADGIEQLSLPEPEDLEAECAEPPTTTTATATIRDLALVTFLDTVTPVPHSHGQLLSSGLLQLQETGLSSDDHLLSAYPLSSIAGLTALFTPWLIAGSTLSLHHPFDFQTIKQQLDDHAISYFAAPDKLLDLVSSKPLRKPGKIAYVWRRGHLPQDIRQADGETQIFDLWNLGELGCIPVRREGNEPDGLFAGGRICLPAAEENELCLAGGEIVDNLLWVKGRIFPSPALLDSSLEWFSLRKRIAKGWLDTGLVAFNDEHDRIVIGNPPEQLKMLGT